MWQLFVISYVAIGLFVVLFTNARDAVTESYADVETEGHPFWKIAAFRTIIYCASVLIWPVFLRSIVSKPKTALDELNEIGIAVIPSVYRSIAEERGEPLPSSLSDQQIFDFYSQAGTAFRNASIEKHDSLTSGVINSIIYKIFQDVGIYGVDHFKHLLECQVIRYQKHGVAQEFCNDPIDLLPTREEIMANGNDSDLSKKIETIYNRCKGPLEIFHEAAELKLRTDIHVWSLDDPILLKYLGYVTGVFDAGTVCTYGKGSSNNLIVETLFHIWVEEKLSGLPLVPDFLAAHLGTISRGNCTIGVLMNKQEFLAAMVKGGRIMEAITQTPDREGFGIISVSLFSDLLELGLMTHVPEHQEDPDQGSNRGPVFSEKSDAIDYAIDLEAVGLRTAVTQEESTGKWQVVVKT